MDINNNQQTNTFTGGMNTDTSDLLLKPSEYRKAINLRPVTNTGENDGELHVINGVQELYMCDVYAMSSIRNYGIIIGKKNDQQSGWGVYRFTNNNTSLKTIFKTDEAIKDTFFSVVTCRESDKNIKVYFTNKTYGLMCVNIAEINNALRSVEDISVQQNVFVQPVVAQVVQSAGQLTAGTIQYAQVCYKLGGGLTLLSPLSNIIQLHDQNRGYKPNKVTDKAVSLQNVGLSGYNVIVYRINYIYSGQLPTINIIYDGEKPSEGTIIDNGSNISEISVDEFIAITGIQFKPLLIEKKDNYLFAANVLYDLLNVDSMFDNQSVLIAYNLVSETATTRVSGSNISQKTFRIGERYRFGVVFYLKDGRRTSVLFTEDITIDPDDTRVHITRSYPDASDTNVYIAECRKYGISVDVSLLNEDLKDIVAGFEVVRCERTVADSTCITQGIIGLGLKANGSGKLIMTSPFMSLNPLKIRNNTDQYTDPCETDDGINSRLIMFASPEAVYDGKNLKTVLQENISNVYFRDSLLYKLNQINESSINQHDDLKDDAGFANGYTLYQDTITGWENNPNKLVCLHEIYATTPSSTDADRALSGSTINAVEYTEAPRHDTFNVGNSIRVNEDVAVVGRYLYVNWFATRLYWDNIGSDDFVWQYDDSLHDTFYKNTQDPYLSVSTGKRCILMDIDVNNNRVLGTSSPDKLAISVVDICKNTPDAFKYGGNSEAAKNNSIFYSFGDYTEIDANGDGTVETYQGDAYIGWFVYNSAHTWTSDRFHALMDPTIYYVPIVSSIDYASMYGDLYPYITTSKKYYFQDEPASIKSYVQNNSAYLYNPAYMLITKAVAFTRVQYDNISIDNFDSRILYSLQKENGERVDSWTKFKPANFIDTDNSYGEITNLRRFKNTLVFWQERATGVLSVNERTIIQDANSSNIILGNGDVLQRYDYITTLYGSTKDKPCDTQSDTTLYWWDYNKAEILGYSGGQSVQPLNKVKNISNFIRANNKVDNPCATYDSDNKEALFTVVKDGIDIRCLVYNEVVQAFTSLYDLPFDKAVSVENKMYLAYESMLCKNNVSGSTQTTNLDEIQPYIKYVVNQNPQYTKVFDIQTFGGNVYNNNSLSHLRFNYTTQLNQTGKTDGNSVSDREGDFRLNVPRAGKTVNGTWTESSYGDRLRGKTMQCELWSMNNSSDFSLQYITTKYRMSWS